MNTIQRIQTVNLKTASIDFQPTALTAVVGPNTGGKTSVAHAIAIGLLGYVPALGKQSTKTAELMKTGERLLDVRLSLKQGTASRTFKKDAKGAVKMTSDGVDYSDSLNPVQLDFEQFTQAKPTDRQRILESLMAATADADVVTQALDILIPAGLDIKLADGEGWLLKLEADARETAKMLKQEIDIAAKTILQLSSEEAPAAVASGTLEKLSQSLNNAREALGAARAAYDGLSAKLENAPEEPEGERYTNEGLLSAEANLESHQRCFDDYDARYKAADVASREAEKIMQPFTGIVPLEATSEVATEEFIDATQRRISNEKPGAQRHATTTESKLATAKALLTEAEKQAEDLKGSQCCPTCGVAGETFREAATSMANALVESRQRDVKTAELNYNTAAAELAEILTAEEKLGEARQIRNQHLAFLARVKADQLTTATPYPEDDAVQLHKNLEVAKREVQQIKRGLQDWAAFEKAEVPTDEQMQKARGEWEGAKTAVEQLEQQERAAKDEQAKVDAYRENQRKVNVMESENTARDTKRKAAEELAGWAKTKSLELTAEAMKPLLEVASKILAGLVEGEIAIDGTVVGVRRNDALLKLEILSGSEAVALACAIQVAIASKSPLRIVQVDELSRFGTDRKQRFLCNLASVIADGTIDQAFVFDHDPQTGFIVENMPGGSKVWHDEVA